MTVGSQLPNSSAWSAASVLSAPHAGGSAGPATQITLPMLLEELADGARITKRGPASRLFVHARPVPFSDRSETRSFADPRQGRQKGVDDEGGRAADLGSKVPPPRRAEAQLTEA
jgi:hypothetical protein